MVTAVEQWKAVVICEEQDHVCRNTACPRNTQIETALFLILEDRITDHEFANGVDEFALNFLFALESVFVPINPSLRSVDDIICNARRLLGWTREMASVNINEFSPDMPLKNEVDGDGPLGIFDEWANIMCQCALRGWFWRSLVRPAPWGSFQAGLRPWRLPEGGHEDVDILLLTFRLHRIISGTNALTIPGGSREMIGFYGQSKFLEAYPWQDHPKIVDIACSFFNYLCKLPHTLLKSQIETKLSTENAGRIVGDELFED